MLRKRFFVVSVLVVVAWQLRDLNTSQTFLAIGLQKGLAHAIGVMDSGLFSNSLSVFLFNSSLVCVSNESPFLHTETRSASSFASDPMEELSSERVGHMKWSKNVIRLTNHHRRYQRAENANQNAGHPAICL